MTTRLSKSRFQKGLQCEKALWLAVHRRELADPITESTQWIFDQGTEVGQLAHGLFPDGIEVTEDHLHSSQALSTTEGLLADGARTLYEPAFRFDGVLVRVDILVPIRDGRWDLYEVKSSSTLKPEHITDAAVQTYVVEGAGLSVRRSCIVHLDTSYVWEGGAYDLARLFAVEDVTRDVRAFMPGIPALLKRFRATLKGPEPHVRIGAQCKKPYPCDFLGYCHASLAGAHPITDLPRLSEGALHSLLDMGVTSICDVPEGFAGLSPVQQEVVRVVKAGVSEIDVAGLEGALANLTWPVYHLDFETVMPALPIWPYTHPYQLIPFQYSVHVHHEDGSYEHREYLHTAPDDPRPALTRQLIGDLDATGSIMHYTPYERRCLRELAAAVPERAADISALRDRLVDLEPIVRRNTLHPATNGRTSIKAVLPAWFPELSYDDLAISDGTAASTQYLRSLRELRPPLETAALYDDLREYCKMDTLAMVKLLEILREQVAE
ncbi:MAG: DUF2779 domain-containing protein [Coriobacteriia bacterium]|jgi:predicted RecB family nuclease|nr:DUF2779 domain-containing protein [Coriobacteriia bacterium]